MTEGTRSRCAGGSGSRSAPSGAGSQRSPAGRAALPARHRPGPAAPTFRGRSHLPGTFAPLRFQNCFLPPSLAMAASPHPRRRWRPRPRSLRLHSPPLPPAGAALSAAILARPNNAAPHSAPGAAREFGPIRSEVAGGRGGAGQWRRGAARAKRSGSARGPWGRSE